MNIFAALQMLVNSNAKKPLNITLDEIQASVNSVRKATRKIGVVKGITYNTNYDSQVLSVLDEPIISIEGSGRILQIIPVTNTNAGSRLGTVLFTVDGEILLNNRARYCYPASDATGTDIVGDTYYPTNPSFVSNLFGTSTTFYRGYSAIFREDSNTFATNISSIVTPNGVPFKNGFELRLSQAITTDETKVGVIVVYELYE